MAQAASLSLERGPDGSCFAAAGDWTLEHAGALERLVAAKHGAADTRRVDASHLGRLDTVGASLLLRLAGPGTESIHGLDGARRALLEAVAGALAPERARPPRPASALPDLLARTGAATEAIAGNALRLVGFFGLVLATLARGLGHPRRWRVTSLVFHLEHTGLDAVPIVLLLSFLVGAVIAFLGATVLRDFGASIFTVELVGYAFLREFGVLLTAILVAGRSGSAFTAQIGSMKAREEIDAIRTLGLDPVEVLVLPRLLALLVTLPALTLLAMLAGILGGGVVSALALDISPGLFLTRLHDLAGLRHFWVGMSKAPLFAFLIASIGCLEGFKVSGSAESVGEHTTSSVVQSIFVVILVDALAAIFFMEIGL
jgi:phospholipid/cholesterol/gamma-HCH transport system permease protein